MISRRKLLLLALSAGPMTATAAMVDEKESLAAALNYVSQSKQAGATCSNCSWYQGKPGDAAGGPCTFFPGKSVAANGWCRMWNKKA